MTPAQWTEPQDTGAGSSPSSGTEHASRRDRSAEGLAEEAMATASDLGSQAKQVASEKAEKLQDAAASHLRTFADAVRNAGDELAEKDPGPISDLVRQAAQGLEQFSGALGRKSTGEMVDGVRDFGRHNPLGFLAGSMLAGFALARFASSSASRTSYGSSDRDYAHGRSAGWSGRHGSSSGEWDADRRNPAGTASFGTSQAQEGGWTAGNQERDAAGAASDPDALGAAGTRDASFESNRRTDV